MQKVLKALKRLGGGKIQTASERWKKKKVTGGESSSQTSDSNKQLILKLTELADSILSNGNMDIYQETYEGIKYKINQSESKKSEADLDMFGEVYTEKPTPNTAVSEKQESQDEPLTKRVRFNEGEKLKSVKVEETPQDTVSWEFKWKNEDEEEIHGPHSTNQMLTWVNEGYFKSGVFVRRVGQPGEFYSSRRVDFDLYL